jgi:hypothetical protein
MDHLNDPRRIKNIHHLYVVAVEGRPPNPKLLIRFSPGKAACRMIDDKLGVCWFDTVLGNVAEISGIPAKSIHFTN